jgi:KaiC/GvpD/RAD55 family RecA-like ATPase
MTNLDIALAHAALGRRVFPLAPDTKKPLVSWPTQASAKKFNIERWWKRTPDAGVGWTLPEGLVVVDVDYPAELTVDLPGAPEQKTTRGYHRLFRTGPDAIVRQGPIPGGDLKVGGKGYVKLYSADAFAGEPPDLPDMVAALRQGHLRARSAPPQELTTRNDLLGYAGRLRSDGAPPDEILAAMLAAQASGRLFDSDPDLPWTEDDLKSIADDIGSKPTEPWPSMPVITHVSRRADAQQRVSTPMAQIERINPEPLVDDFAHPTNHTILYGPNGSGKGVVASWKIAARTAAGEVVLILDYEGHPSEWRARLEDAGADLSMVHIALPLGMENGFLSGAVWKQAEDIRDDAERVGASWVYVDSISAACGVADITDSTAPGPYFAALNMIGRPSVSLGHVTKVENLKYPFGSMLWRAYVRMAWSFAGEGDRRELVNRKTNDYPAQPSVALDWSWTTAMPPHQIPREPSVAGPVSRPVEARAFDAIGEDELTAVGVHERVVADGFGDVSVRTVQNALSRSIRFEQPKGRRGLWRRLRVTVTHGGVREEIGKSMPAVEP